MLKFHVGSDYLNKWTLKTCGSDTPHDVIPIIGCEIMLWQRIWANLCKKCEQEGTWDTPLLCTSVTAKWITTQARRRVEHILKIYVSNQPLVFI